MTPMRHFALVIALGLPAFSASLRAQSPPTAPDKVAIIDIQRAIAQSTDGQQAARELQTKFAPKRGELEKAQQEIAALEEQLRNQQATLSDDARSRLLRTRDDKTRAFTRANEDATAEWQQAEQDAINQIGSKMMNVVRDYAEKNGFGLVVDVSSPQTPVLYAHEALNITDQIIQLYNQSAAKPAASGSAPATPTAAPPAAGGSPPPAETAPPASAPAQTPPASTP